MSTQVHFTCPPELLERVDSVRGLIPRAAFIRDALEAACRDFPDEVNADSPQRHLTPSYTCRHCSFTALSPSAKCPVHTGALIPA